MAADPPVPISATMALPMGTWSVTFDKPLQAGALDASNWSFRAGDEARTADDATASGSVVSGDSTAGVEDPGADVVNYGASPADVLGLDDMPAAAFVDFPMATT